MKTFPVPFLCAGATMERVNPAVQARVVEALTGKRGAVLHGPTGTGKTCAMIAAMRAIERAFSPRRFGPNVMLDEERNQGCAFVDWPDFIGDFDDRKNALQSLLAWRGALFVDDVGQEQSVASGYKQGEAESIFDRFVNRRTGIDAALWITTNLTPNEMRDRYGERALSRLSEHCQFIRFEGIDRRLHAV